MREHRWMLALVGRCLGYGWLMGLCFWGITFGIAMVAFEVLLVLGIIAAICFSGADPIRLAELAQVVIPLTLVLGLGSSLIGAAGGAVAGFYSPREEKNLSFFFGVYRNGSLWLSYGVLGGFASGAGLASVLWLFSQEMGLGWLPVLPLAWVGQAYGLWRGINLARRDLLIKSLD